MMTLSNISSYSKTKMKIIIALHYLVRKKYCLLTRRCQADSSKGGQKARIRQELHDFSVEKEKEKKL
jgi:hypothetical protein